MKVVLIGFGVIALIVALTTGWRVLDTAIDREVMEQSHQFKQSMKHRRATLRANIEEIEIRLESDPNNQGLLDQRSALRAQMKAVSE